MSTVTSLSTKELCTAADVTFRQLDFWTRNGVIETVAGGHGSGHYRRYHPNVVPVVRLLGVLSRGMKPPTDMQHRIVEAFDDGQFTIEPGVRLVWDR